MRSAITEVVRRNVTTDGLGLTLEYDGVAFHVGTRFAWLARNLRTLELGTAMIETLGMCTKGELRAAVKAVRVEYKRLKCHIFDPPAQKEWAIIRGALNRVEGKTLRVRKHGLEEWL